MLRFHHLKQKPGYWYHFQEEMRCLIAENRRDIAEKQISLTDRISLAFCLVNNSYDLICGLYSAGARGDKICEAADALFVDINMFYDMAKTVPAYMHKYYSGMYYDFLTYLCIAVCFDIEKERCRKLVAFYDLMYGDGMDFIFETMLAYKGVGSRRQTSQLLEPNILGGLYRVFNSEAALRPVYLQEFVKNWYRLMRQEGFYHNHLTLNCASAGYWCIEAAATARMLKIDDRALQKNNYYPYAIAHCHTTA